MLVVSNGHPDVATHGRPDRRTVDGAEHVPDRRPDDGADGSAKLRADGRADRLVDENERREARSLVRDQVGPLAGLGPPLRGGADHQRGRA